MDVLAPSCNKKVVNVEGEHHDAAHRVALEVDVVEHIEHAAPTVRRDDLVGQPMPQLARLL